MTKFFSDGPCRDRAYGSCRDSKLKRPIHLRVERLWRRYAPICPDRNFLSAAKAAFVEKTWEMYLACTLLERGFKLTKPSGKGPDIHVTGPVPIWVEAIAPDAGSGPDAVPTRDKRGETTALAPGVAMWTGVPPSEESLILRCTSAIAAKAVQRERYIEDGIVRSTEPFVVAINLAQIDGGEDACDDDEVPIVAKAALGIGEDYYAQPLFSRRKGRWTHGHRPHVVKASTAKVSAHGFLSGQYDGVSGIMCSCVSIVNAPSAMGADIIFLHNPTARAPIPAGTFRFGTEWTVRATLKRRRWSPRRAG
jgi:hypothetical protein